MLELLQRCGIVSGRGKRRVVTAGAKWTGRIGDVVRRHDFLSSRFQAAGPSQGTLFWVLRSRCRPQEGAQIADLRFELIHRHTRRLATPHARQEKKKNCDEFSPFAGPRHEPGLGKSEPVSSRRRPGVERHVMFASPRALPLTLFVSISQWRGFRGSGALAFS